LQNIYGSRVSDVLHVKIEGVPPSLLPGNATEFAIDRSLASDFEVKSLLWVYYWLPPVEEDEEDCTYDGDIAEQWGSEESTPELPKAMVYITSNPEQIQDGAQPIAGVLYCPGAQNAPIHLDGHSLGPWPLHPVSTKQGDDFCFASEISITPVCPSGFSSYEPKEPSPLLQRCRDFHEDYGSSECELERLASGTPVCIGYLLCSNSSQSDCSQIGL
jgi:hypothetical protein